jgi:transcriptional regulator GlxA family with amidase domain
VIFDEVEELDFAGPWEVFTAARHGHEADRVLTIAPTEGVVRCAKGLRVLPDCSFDAAPPLDVVVVPGGQGTRREAENPAFLDWLREAAARCTWVLENRRYVRDGNLVTAAGVSAGIDMALWVVGQIYGVDHARLIQKWIEYDPAPPYAADV